MANEIEPIQPREPKVSHAVEMRYRALANQIRTVKSYGLGNPEITQMLGLGRLPRQNLMIDEAQWGASWIRFLQFESRCREA